MEKTIATILFCFFVVTQLVSAHPPAKIVVEYDSATRMLTATISHPVADPKTHFIRKVDIAINGEEILEHRISRQDNDTTQSVSYLIPDAKKGDTISVEAYCNIGGKLTKEIKVR